MSSTKAGLRSNSARSTLRSRASSSATKRPKESAVPSRSRSRPRSSSGSTATVERELSDSVIHTAMPPSLLEPGDTEMPISRDLPISQSQRVSPREQPIPHSASPAVLPPGFSWAPPFKSCLSPAAFFSPPCNYKVRHHPTDVSAFRHIF